MYSKNDDLFLEEIMLLYAAATGTVTSSTCSLIHQACLNPQIYQKLISDIERTLGNDKSKTIQNITYDNILEMTYLGYFFNECLRIDPPFSYSMSYNFT